MARQVCRYSIDHQRLNLVLPLTPDKDERLAFNVLKKFLPRSKRRMTLNYSSFTFVQCFLPVVHVLELRTSFHLLFEKNESDWGKSNVRKEEDLEMYKEKNKICKMVIIYYSQLYCLPITTINYLINKHVSCSLSTSDTIIVNYSEVVYYSITARRRVCTASRYAQRLRKGRSRCTQAAR